MQTSDEGTLTVLRSLLRLSQDSAEGYAKAEGGLQDLQLVRELESHRQKRLKMIEELKGRIRDMREDPSVGPTVIGELHRQWMELRAQSAGNSSEALLSEVERGEDVAVDSLRYALRQTDLDSLTRKMLERHYEWVQAAHDRVKQLRDRATYARA